MRVVAVGIAWGVFCALANLSVLSTTIAQMATPWVWLAALVGFRAPGVRGAAVDGAVTLLAANVAYFAATVTAAVLSDGWARVGVSFFVLWTIVGAVVGPIAGALGFGLRSSGSRPIAAAALTSISIAEPLALWAHIQHPVAHITYALVALCGCVIPRLAFGAGNRASMAALIGGVAAAYPAGIMLELVLILLGQVSAPMRLV